MVIDLYATRTELDAPLVAISTLFPKPKPRSWFALLEDLPQWVRSQCGHSLHPLLVFSISDMYYSQFINSCQTGMGCSWKGLGIYMHMLSLGSSFNDRLSMNSTPYDQSTLLIRAVCVCVWMCIYTHMHLSSPGSAGTALNNSIEMKC